jgi:circadian clock protein KaiB
VTKPKDSVDSFRAAAARTPSVRYELCLFIAGTTPLSATALANVVDICDERLAGRYDLTVVDVYQEPARARAEEIIAIPTLLKKSPPPLRRLIGDLSDRAAVLKGLELATVASTRTAKETKGPRPRSSHDKAR